MAKSRSKRVRPYREGPPSLGVPSLPRPSDQNYALDYAPHDFARQVLDGHPHIQHLKDSIAKAARGAAKRVMSGRLPMLKRRKK